jgi:tetratricopeptide (TPR) repeat protein/predicted Ser/Thr protein kinase
VTELGTMIRDIRLVAPLGTGGMGEVFLGHQETLGREVAVKAVRADRRMDATAKARFLREARILSRLEHPNICRIYDFIESDGSDFIVLELVRGSTLRELMAEPITDADKMRIAEQIIAALEAAHAISVVHRDLKPENIIVGDDGTVKVLDFGLARDIPRTADPADPTAAAGGAGLDADSDEWSRPDWTRLGDVMGTPRYMSPEQARGEALTAASDVYAFGLLMHELWTGSAPYGEGRDTTELVQRAMWGEIQPAHGIDPQVAQLITDLTAFEPGRRPSAAAAADRLRWIRERPARRSRRLAVVAVMAALAVAAVASTAGFLHARRSQRRAVAARAEAEAVNEFLRGMLASAAPDKQGIDTRVIDVLDAAAARVDADFADHPLSCAAVHFTLGETYLALGAGSAAHDHLDTSATISRVELGPDDPATMRTENLIGVALYVDGRYAESEELLRGVLERSRSILGDQHIDTVNAAANLANVLQKLGRYDEAEPMVRADVEWNRREFGEEDDHTLKARLRFANLLSRMGRGDEAEAEYRDIVSFRQRAFGADHPETLSATSNLAVLLSRDPNHAEEALAIFEDTVERRRRVLGEEHPDALRSLDMQAVHLRRLGRFADAERLTREVLETRRRSLGSEHPDTIDSEMSLAIVLTKQGRLEEAEGLFRGARARAERILGPDHRTTLNILGNLANLLVAGQRFHEAEALQRRLVDRFHRTFGENHPMVLSARNNLANALIAQGKIDEAAPLVRETLAADREILGSEHPRTLNALGNYAVVLQRQGDMKGAEKAFRELLGTSERVFGPDHPRTGRVRQDLATLLRETGRDREGAALEPSTGRPAG